MAHTGGAPTVGTGVMVQLENAGGHLRHQIENSFTRLVLFSSVTVYIFLSSKKGFLVTNLFTNAFSQLAIRILKQTNKYRCLGRIRAVKVSSY